ncbi:hypothetical protein SDC9_55606 [bioreactor metagenome]|uniref:Uncharacterized protein n=1 Tax=bioreactor metagenome TaxID=1076179 RepID=A0A644WZF3_9ZZZZ
MIVLQFSAGSSLFFQRKTIKNRQNSCIRAKKITGWQKTSLNSGKQRVRITDSSCGFLLSASCVSSRDRRQPSSIDADDDLALRMPARNIVNRVRAVLQRNDLFDHGRNLPVR